MIKTTEELIKSLVVEYNPLNERVNNLRKLLECKRPEFISEQEWMLLHDQLDAMNDYGAVLCDRIAIHAKKLDPKNEYKASLGEL